MSIAWQYHLLKIFSRFVCLLPYSAVLFIGRILGRLYYRIAAKQRQRAVRQIREGLSLSENDAQKVIEKLFINIGQTVLEVLYTPNLTPDTVEQYITIEHREYLDEALAKGKGVVFLTAHIGNWEWLGAALSLAGFPMTSVIKRQPNEQYTRLLNEFRELVGLQLFASGGNEMIGAAKALKKGKVLGFLSDQDGGKEGVWLSFFGKFASTPQGAAAFSHKFTAPLVPGFIIRKKQGGHKVVLYPPLSIENSGDKTRDIEFLTKQYTKVIEMVIRQYPDQWLWFQKRWNTKYESSVIKQGR